MRIAVASGKGGTGKTTVATNLAWVASQSGKTVCYIDCDVEEPNGALFLKPQITKTTPVKVSVPRVNSQLCKGCGHCGQLCQYSAIVVINRSVIVFPELCHSCGGCWLVCPTAAITESFRETGQIEEGEAGGVCFVGGLLNIGETMSPPVIRAAKGAAPEVDLLVVDSPPGTSCPVIEAVRGVDFVLLVTEPTPFGLHDLKLTVEMLRAIKIPFGAVINRADVGDHETEDYCAQEGIEILASIPDDRRIAETYSRGEIICDALPEYRAIFSQILNRLVGLKDNRMP
jgi:MinD superfamily P-loop ATPase